ncbi:hypothetical protein BJV82DRAFT_286508 [Fennellomyces sp. T-0311]|nr:hypothetical protein BJV82DRAFT_286508 [Fennellomyces sp. T-0311]
MVKGHTLWNPAASVGGILRPKPIDCMVVFFILFNTLRLLTSVVLIEDIAPNNWIARSFIFEFPWDVGLAGLTLYLIGIAQTISQSHSVRGWLPSPVVIDIVGFSMLLVPIIIGIPLTIAAGALAERNLFAAEILVRVNYTAWFLWTGAFGAAVLYAALRLVSILKEHHKGSRHSQSYAAVEAGIYKIQSMAFIFTVSLWCFALFLLLFGILRDQIMRNKVVSIILGIFWTQLAQLSTLCVQILILCNPKFKRNPALRSKSSSGGTTDETTSSTRPDQNFGGSTIYAVTATFQDDDEAILNAIKENPSYNPYFPSSSSRNKSNTNFFNNSSKRRGSDSSYSSQVELTSFSAH